jgi:uncharacterized HAD superfamily protein
MTNKIGVDLDEIISETFPSILKYNNRVHNIPINDMDFYKYDYWKRMRDDLQPEIKEFYQTEGRDMKPIQGAYESLQQLKNLGYELYVITARSAEFSKQTKDWVNKNFPNIFIEVLFTNAFNKNIKAQSKSDVCKSLGIKIFVEDDPHYIEDCINAGIKVIYLDYPWNRKVNFKNSFKVYSWKEIAGKILELK